MANKRYTSGEIASAAGLTIRAVQYYDNIGLLPSSGRTEGGRRYYTRDDLIRLEQIVFYKSLDFSLGQIKNYLLSEPNSTELMEMFKNQQLLLLQRMEHFHTAFATIGIMSNMIEAGKEPPLHILVRFLSALPGDDFFSHATGMITKEQQRSLSLHFHDIEPAQIFYHRWKELLIEATILLNEDVAPDSTSAQDLAKRWWEAILSMTGGNLGLIKQISELHLEKQISTNNGLMLEAANRFIDNAFDIFSSQNDLCFDARFGAQEK